MTSGRRILLPLFLVIALGCAFRLVALDRIPGINGDEAWFGVNVQQRVAHRAAFERTPSGLPLDPFHTIPLEFVTRVAPPSFWALRFPAAFWNVLALLLAYPLLAAPLGRVAALLATLFIAVSPAAIAYSRISWEPSETVFFSLLILAFAARGWLEAALFTFACSLLAHPTNIFLFPVLLGAFAGAASARSKWIGPAAILAFAGVAAAALYLGKFVLDQESDVARGITLAHPSEIWVRAVDPELWWATIRGVVRLLTGITTGRSIAGAVPSGIERGIEVAGFLLVGFRVAIAFLFLPDESKRSFVGLTLGFLVSIAAFHLFAGPRAIGTPHERYALVFVVPACILIAVPVEGIRHTHWRIAALVTTSWIALSIFSFVAGYAVPLFRDGGNAHVTYRTGKVEPKKAAFVFIGSELQPGETAALSADSWWIYWPLRYLTAPVSDRIQVEPARFQHPPVAPPGAAPPSLSQTTSRGFAIAFADSSPLQISEGRQMFVASDPRDRPILRVFELERRTGERAP
ncbi:MAG TPA: hypothetical protein VFR10_12515 [bacterium]|nr:hypothetical protein [bacterium]